MTGVMNMIYVYPMNMLLKWIRIIRFDIFMILCKYWFNAKIHAYIRVSFCANYPRLIRYEEESTPWTDVARVRDVNFRRVYFTWMTIIDANKHYSDG